MDESCEFPSRGAIGIGPENLLGNSAQIPQTAGNLMHFSATLSRILASVLLLGLGASNSRGAADGGELFPAGVASIDITPEYPIRLSGYGGRRTSSEGVEQHLYAKALALGTPSDGSLALLLTVDNTGVPAWITERVHQGISAVVSFPREQFALCSSHTHTGPMLSGVLSNLFAAQLTSDEAVTIARYSDELVTKLVAVGLAAVRDRAPSELWWAQGRAGFAKNRRTRGGPVDHDLPVLGVRGSDGRWKGLFMNYACHCTTLGGDFNRHCGDWAGYAQEYLEEEFPGLRALVGIGCGADSDPQPRNALQPAKDHGREVAREVARLLRSPLSRIHALPRGGLERLNLSFDTLPTRGEWEKRASDPGIVGYHARLNLARLDRGEVLPTELPYSVQTWVFGDDLAMVFLPGEVVVDYSLRIKRTYLRDRLWVNAYANDVPCYIPSARVWDEGGYEGGGAMPYYDRPTRLARDTEERILGRVVALLPPRFKDPDGGKEMTPPRSPAEALRTLRTRPGLGVELVASEPLVVDPVAIDFGADGRLWVVEMHDYPLGLDGHFKPGGRLAVLSDRDGDGRFDTVARLVEDLPFPTGVMAWRKGALVCAAPDILYIEDTDGDGKADIRQVLYTGFATHNFQARVNSLRWGLDGWIYGAAGLFGGTIHSTLTGKDHPLSGQDFRIRPETGEFESVSGLSQQGRVRDDVGNWFGCDNGAWLWHFPFPEHYLRRNPALTAGETRVYVPSEPNANEVFPISRTLERFNDPDNANRTTSACGVEIYRAGLLGPDYYGNSFTCEPVHNLVRRFLVSPIGGTFEGRKPDDEAHTEFLASTDNWFRPVEIRTGPDGAIWVVDMYRFVVEHPRWISPERLARLDPRAGDQQGRIYRVRPESGPVRSAAWGDLTLGGAGEWIRLLGGENGVLRDLAQRLLRERGGRELVSRVRDILTGGGVPAARIQAMHLVAEWGGLDDTALAGLLGDRSPAVRIAALQMAESRGVDASWAERVAALANDPAGEVRHQAALTLGEFQAPAAGAALGRLATRDPSDSRMRAAVLSSATRFAPRILADVLALAEETPGRSDWVRELIRTGSQSADPAVRAAILLQVIPAATAPVSPSHLEAAAGLMGPTSRFDPDSPLGRGVSRLLDSAREVARDATAATALKTAALTLLARGPVTPGDLDLLGQGVRPDQDPALQRVALAGLRHIDRPEVADLLLNQWEKRPSAARGELLEELAARESWAVRLLDVVQRGVIPRGEIPPALRQRLLASASPTLARRAGEVFPRSPDSSRADAVKAYASVARLVGNPDLGSRIFLANCTGCHEFRGNGHAVGPDLATYREKAVGDFLVAILDPGAAVEPRFVNHHVETRDDRLLSGVLRDETANGFTLLQGGGVAESFLRSEVVRVTPATGSLMPEGFEGVILPQGMADLIAYLKSGAPGSFGGAPPPEAEAARRVFLQQPGFTGWAGLRATEVIDYRCWMGTWPLHHCRQSDGKGRVEWQTAVPGAALAAGEWVEFTLPVAMGHRSQPKGSFTLRLNGRDAFQFDVALGDAFWEGVSPAIRAYYRVKERNTEDSNGILVLQVARDQVRPGEVLRWEVRGSATGSLRWFGLYDVQAKR